MKRYMIMVLLTLAFLACKNEDSASASKPTKEKSNVIQQKVTVSAETKNLNIDAKTAVDMIEKDNNIKVLDVRTPKEIKEGAYPNSLQIDFNKRDFKTEINKLDKKDTYIVYCKSGGRSKKAVSMMKAFGFNKVFNMEEGYDGFAKISK